MTAKLVQFPIVSRQDVPGTLRAIADEIERGDYDAQWAIEMVCIVRNTQSGARMVWGSNLDRAQVYRLLGLGQHWMNEEES
jgi:hypothetical protein